MSLNVSCETDSCVKVCWRLWRDIKMTDCFPQMIYRVDDILISMHLTDFH